MGRSHPVRCVVAALVGATLTLSLSAAQRPSERPAERPVESGRAKLFPPIDLGLLDLLCLATGFLIVGPLPGGLGQRLFPFLLRGVERVLRLL